METEGGMDAEVAQRLAQLETRVRRLRLGLFVLGAALCAALAMGASDDGQVHDVLNTRKLRVLDAAGELVLLAGAPDENGGTLAILDKAGQPVFWAGVSEDGAGGSMHLYDRSGQDVLRAGATEHGGMLRVGDTNGQPGLIALVGQSGGKLHILDKAGNGALSAFADEAGGALTIYDRSDHGVFAAGAGENGGLMGILNRTGDSVVQAHADKAGEGYVGVWDRQGKGRTLAPR